MIDLALDGHPTGIPGVVSHDSFDKAIADAGGYGISVAVRTSVGRGTVLKPVRSVGASPRVPGRFYFATDDRFRRWPGFGLVWPSAAAIEGVRAVPVTVLEQPVELSREDVAGVNETFRQLEQIAIENGLPAEEETP
jgi:hypothetical protein